MSNNGFKLVTKFYEDYAKIYCIFRSGECYDICTVSFPKDNQQLENQRCVKSIVRTLQRRLEASMLI